MRREKVPVIKSKHLILSPLSDEALMQKVLHASDPELRSAYEEMLSLCRAHPKDRIWYTAWEIRRREDNALVGDLCFKGPSKNSAVEIGYGMEPGFTGRGYCTEACKALIDWAFLNYSDVVFVEAEAEPQNVASQRVLEKLGFVPDGTGKEGLRFVLEKDQVSWVSVYMCLGLSVGMSIGVAAGHIGVGMCIGIGVGALLGAMLKASEAQKRIEQRKARESRDR